jgi:dTDP-4-amino-4,6-dideoxygalactose transaminase
MRFVTSLHFPGKQEKLMRALRSIADSGQYTEGVNVFRLERMFAAMMRGQSAIAFNSRGSALYTLFRYYASIGHRNVAIQNNCFFAVGAMALEAGLSVHLVDSGPSCPSMGVDALRGVLVENKAITLAVLYHVGGWVAADYPSILALCGERKVTLAEDCSSVIGVTGEYQQPGACSDASCWSFQVSSAVPVGGGAILSTGNVELRNYVQLFHCYGKHISNGVTRYGPGQDLRMSEWDAAVACVQMDHLPQILEARARDAYALESIAPCLLSGDNNHQSYPVDPLYANKRVTAPSIYAATEQLATSLPFKNVVSSNLVHSARWAQNHRCLPLGEGVYDGMGTKDILDVLKK